MAWAILGKIGLKSGAKAGAKVGTKTGTKVASRVGVRTGIVVGAGSLWGISNVFQGDGILGSIGDFLGLDSIGALVQTLVVIIIGSVIGYFALKLLFGRKKRG